MNIGDTMQTDHPSLQTDTALSLVADSQRRFLIGYLRQQDQRVVPVEELVDVLNAESGPHSQSAREAIEIRLQHSHLPKLAEAGIIEYDLEAATVQYRQISSLETLLDFVSEKLE